MLEFLLSPETWAALVTLTVLEVVLGIDNIVFISIVSSNLPAHQRPSARKMGLAFAVITRLLLLASVFWLAHITRPLFTVFGEAVSVRDIVLLAGGLFLLAKATMEIHDTFEKEAGNNPVKKHKHGATYAGVVIQIMILDVVFSLDSVITAIGMTDHIVIMGTAIVVAVGFMMFFVNAVSEFVHRHPTVKMLALSFLLLIGMALIAEGFDLHIPRGYLYFAMGFSFFVESMNIQLRKRNPDLRVTSQHHDDSGT